MNEDIKIDKPTGNWFIYTLFGLRLCHSNMLIADGSIINWEDMEFTNVFILDEYQSDIEILKFDFNDYNGDLILKPGSQLESLLYFQFQFSNWSFNIN